MGTQNTVEELVLDDLNQYNTKHETNNKADKLPEKLANELLIASKSKRHMRFALFIVITVFLGGLLGVLIALLFIKSNNPRSGLTENIFNTYIVSLAGSFVGCLLIMVKFAFNMDIEAKIFETYIISNSKAKYKNATGNRHSKKNPKNQIPPPKK